MARKYAAEFKENIIARMLGQADLTGQ